MLKIFEVKNYYSWQANSYLVYDDDLNAILFDPNGSDDSIDQFILKKHLNLKAIICTHGHFDHITGVDKYKNKYDCEFLMHELDFEMLNNPDLNSSRAFGLSVSIKSDPTGFIYNQMCLHFLNEPLFVLHTPFHTQGSCVLYFKESKIAISGDSLFKHGYGRMDLYGGDESQVSDSLKYILSLPNDVIVYPGHGENTTIGQERKYLFNK